MTVKNDEQNGILAIQSKDIQVLYEKFELAERERSLNKTIVLSVLVALETIFHISPDIVGYLMEAFK